MDQPQPHITLAQALYDAERLLYNHTPTPDPELHFCCSTGTLRLATGPHVTHDPATAFFLTPLEATTTLPDRRFFALARWLDNCISTGKLTDPTPPPTEEGPTPCQP